MFCGGRRGLLEQKVAFFGAEGEQALVLVILLGVILDGKTTTPKLGQSVQRHRTIRERFRVSLSHLQLLGYFLL